MFLDKDTTNISGQSEKQAKKYSEALEQWKLLKQTNIHTKLKLLAIS